MIKFLSKLFGTDKRKQKSLAKTNPKPLKIVVDTSNLVELAVSKTDQIAEAERQAALLRNKKLNTAVLNKILHDAIGSAHTDARSRSYDAAKHAETAGKGRSEVLKIGNERARFTYRAAIDRAIEAYKAEHSSLQHDRSAKDLDFPHKGSDINRSVSLSLKEVYEGAKRRITLDNRTVEVEVPRGATSGTVIKVIGAGNNGINHGPRGDLVVTIRVTKDPLFERKGDDIYCRVGILVKPGDAVDVPTLEGHITIGIPETIGCAKWIPLVGYGMPKTETVGAWGDLYYELVELSSDRHDNYLTKSGYSDLLAEEKLLEERLKRLGKATGQTEPRESKVSKNADFHDLQESQSMVIGRLQQIRGILQKAQVVDQSGLISNYVIFGSTVVLREAGSDVQEEYQVVGAAESNPRERKISINSPIGSAVFGKKKNDIVTVVTPDGTIQLAIVDVKVNQSV